MTKTAATLSEPVPLGDRKDMVYRGTAVAQGVGRAVVTATGMATEMGAIAEMLEQTRQDPSPLQKEIAAVGKLLGITVIVIAVVVMIVTALVNHVSTLHDFVTVLLLGVSLAVAADAGGIARHPLGRVGHRRAAHGPAECHGRRSCIRSRRWASATVIASDKTGTLTKNEMTIQRIRTASGEVELTGVGYRPDGSALAGGRELSDPALVREARHGACGRLAGQQCATGVPRRRVADPRRPDRGGIPGRRAQARGHRRPRPPVRAPRRGAVHLGTQDDVRSGRGGRRGRPRWWPRARPTYCCSAASPCRSVSGWCRWIPTGRAAALAAVEELSAEAFRTLGVAYRRLDEAGAPDRLDEGDEQDLVYVGVVGIIDPPRPEVADAVAEARRAGVRVMMITGDHPATAERIAEDLGIVEPGSTAVTGAQLDALDATRLREVTATTSVYARVAPQNKLQIVDSLQDQGEVVAMTGDGVNDAPALKSADIGVAMGITGTQVTKEAAKMILADDNFTTIVAAVRQGRVIFDNIKKSLRYLLSSNIGEVFTVFFGVVFAGFIGIAGASHGDVVVPLLATQILWINLVTDSGPALAMGVDPEIDDVMARPPRRMSERIIDREMWLGILAIGLVMGAATLLTMDMFLPGGLIEGSDSLQVARTAGFTTLALAQLFNAFNSRSETTSAFRRPFRNRWLWASVALAAGLQIAVVELPFLQRAFGTVPLDLAHWGVAIAMASVVLWFGELRKLFLRAIDRRNSLSRSRS